MDIIIHYKGKLYIIDKEPFESNEDVYKRGWFIVKNQGKYCKEELISLSIINNNLKKGMEYIL